MRQPLTNANVFEAEQLQCFAPDEQAGEQHDIREADLAKEHQPAPDGIDGFQRREEQRDVPSGSMMRNSVTTAEEDVQERSYGLLVRGPRASEARLDVEHGQGPIVKLPRLRGTVGNRGHPELAVFGERADQVKQYA